MNQKRGLWIALILVNVLFTRELEAQVQTTVNQSMNLTQAIKTSLANATEIKQALFQIEDADQQVLVSWGEVFPKLDTDIGYQRNMEVPVNFLPASFVDKDADPNELTPIKFGTDNNWTGGFTISQTLFRGEALVGIATADLYRLAQKENFRAKAQQVVTQTRLAYYAVLIAQESYRVQKATIERLQKNLTENEARYKAGLVDDYDVLRLKVQLKNEEPALMNAENTIQESYRNLNIAMGLPVNVRFTILGDLKDFDIIAVTSKSEVNSDIKKVDQMIPFNQQDPASFNGVLESNRGDIRSLKVALNLQDQRIFADKSNFLPELSASYAMRWNAAQPGSLDFFGTADQRARSQVLGVNLKWNLFNGLKQYTALQKSMIEKKSLEENKRFALESALNQTITAQDRLGNLLELHPSVLEGLALSKTGYDRVLIRQKNGLATQLDVTDAEIQLKQAELNYANLVFNYLSAKAQYDFAIGKVPFINEGVN